MTGTTKNEKTKKKRGGRMRSAIYDRVILSMTTSWYREVLGRLPRGARVLDVGIGTGGALVRNAATVRERDLRIVGVDIDADYVARARTRVADAGLEERVDVRLESVGDHRDGPYDAVYFSGSFMLMPDKPGILRRVGGELLAEGGLIYFTQTIHARRAPVMERIKPALRKLTTIDFGRVTYEEDFRVVLEEADVELLEMTEMERRGKRSFRVMVARPR